MTDSILIPTALPPQNIAERAKQRIRRMAVAVQDAEFVTRVEMHHILQVGPRPLASRAKEPTPATVLG